jgi:hypothetical protein
MSADRDLTRTVRSWLHTDEHESAERVLDDVLALLDATPQRRPWWPARRIADMNTYAKLAIAAAAVVVAAVVGINLFPARGGIGPGVPVVTPSPSPAPTPTLQPSPSSSPAVVFPARGVLASGRHAFSQNGVGFSLEFAGSGWASSGIVVADGGNLTKGFAQDKDAAWMLLWSIDGVYADPCGQATGPPLSPSADDLASAVATLPGAELVAGPEDVTLGGRSATHVAITIPDDIACAPSDFFLWYDAAGCDGDTPCGRWVSALGETNHVWIFEVDGKHVWIEAETYKGASPELEREVQQIVESIRFE